MRKLSRELKPATFPIQFTGQNRIDWELELLKEFRRVRLKEIKKVDFRGKSSRWKNAKENLTNESCNKCAYCECYFKTVAYGDVEHYRPKSKYWWLAYSYHNYSASCQLCNQKYKKAKFPKSSGSYKAPTIRKNSTDKYLESIAGKVSVDPLSRSGMSLTQFKKNHKSERPLSIDPYIDNPASYFAYDHNDSTREVIITPKTKKVEKIVDSSINLFGLNRKELRDLRYRGLIKYRFNRQVVETASDAFLRQAGLNILDAEYYDDKSEFSGMFNYYKKKKLIPLPI